jgi:hypothetical protein
MGFLDSFKSEYNRYIDRAEGKLKETNRAYEQKVRETGRRNFEIENSYARKMDSLENSRFKK